MQPLTVWIHPARSVLYVTLPLYILRSTVVRSALYVVPVYIVRSAFYVLLHIQGSDDVWDMNEQVMYWLAPASNRPVRQDYACIPPIIT